MADEQFDLLARFIHGIIGGIVGALIGWGVAHFWLNGAPTLMVIGGVALVLAILAFFIGDPLWHWISELARW